MASAAVALAPSAVARPAGTPSASQPLAAITPPRPASPPVTPARAPATPARAPAAPAHIPAPPAHTPAASAHTPATPARTEATPARTEATPARTPATPARTPATPARTPATSARALDPAEAAHRQALRAKLDAILKGRILSRLQVGVQVVDPEGEVLYGHRADAMLKAASNTKIFTTSAAFMLLGGGFQLRTTVVGKRPDTKGVVRGDLYLRGAGDPYLSSTDLQRLAKALHAQGIRRVTGGIVADQSREGKERGRGTGGLSLDRATFRVVVAPGRRVRARPRVSVAPGLSRYFKLVNRARTVRRGRLRLKVTTRDVGARTVVTVTGRIPLRHRAVSISRNPRHSSLFVGYSLRAALDGQGITVARGVRAGRAPRGLTTLAEHRSPTLAAMARPINKNSNNFMAERLFQVTGAELYGGPPTSAKGTRAVAAGLARLGLERTAGRWNQVDGSGLSHSNRMAPAFVAEVLRRLLRGDPVVGADFFQSLSVGGRDGTIRGRFPVGSGGGIVFGKTGTLRDTSCLSGYVRAAGRSLIFSILMNGTGRRTIKRARQAQNEIAMAIYHYLSRNGSASAPVPDAHPGEVDREGPSLEGPEIDESREITDEGVPVPEFELPLPGAEPPAPFAPPRLAPPAGLRAPLPPRGLTAPPR